MPTRTKLAALAISLPLLALVGVAGAQQPAGDTDTDYAARAMTAAPPEVAHNATIVRLNCTPFRPDTDDSRRA